MAYGGPMGPPYALLVMLDVATFRLYGLLCGIRSQRDLAALDVGEFQR